MTTLYNVKEIKLKGKQIHDVDIEPITLPVPTINSNNTISYTPGLTSLKDDTLLTEKSLPIAYTLKGENMDPTQSDFTNKLLTLSTIREIKPEVETQHLQIAYSDTMHKNVYQFGEDSGIKEFDLTTTSTKPLSVNIFANTKTTPFTFAKNAKFGNNFITERALESTYINDQLVFDSTLTSNANNQSIQHKLLTSDAFENAYIPNKLIFADTLTDNAENISENYSIDPLISHKLLTTNILDNAYLKKSLIFDSVLNESGSSGSSNTINSLISHKLLTADNFNGVYVNGTLIFADTLTDNVNRISLVNKSIDDLISHKLLTANALDNAYLKNKLIFADTLTDNAENISENYSIDPLISHKLLTANALDNAYVTTLNLKNADWLNANKDKLLTVNALNTINFDDVGSVSVDDMILYNRYECNVIENLTPPSEYTIYSTKIFTYSIDSTGKNIKIYHDGKLIKTETFNDVIDNVTFRYTETVANNGNKFKESYLVHDKYYGLQFEVYSMDNKFTISYFNNGNQISTDEITVEQNIAHVAFQAQTNDRKLSIGAVLKYCNVNYTDTNMVDIKSYIIEYMNPNYTFMSDKIIIADELLFGDNFNRVTVSRINTNRIPEIIYDDNEYSLTTTGGSLIFRRN